VNSSSLEIEFYSERPVSVVSTISTMLGDRVFCGEHWDDFALAGLCLAQPGRALLLGLGAGAGIRPLFASGGISTVHAVDIDQESIDYARNLYANNFNTIAFNATQSDAMQFLADGSDPYDVICVDVYGDKKFIDYLSGRKFWELVRLRTSSTGFVMVNAFGLPWHLDPLTKNSLQTSMVRAAASAFDAMSIIPSRRNLTLLLSSSTLGVSSRSPAAPGQLSEPDQLGLRVQRARLGHSLRLAQLPPPMVAHMPAEISVLDRTLVEAWPAFLHILRDTAPGPLLDLANPLSALVRDVDYSYLTIKLLLGKGLLAAASFFPTFAAVEAFSNRDQLDPFWEMMSRSALEFYDASPEFVSQFLLPQMFASEARSPSPRQSVLARIASVMDTHERRMVGRPDDE
jgi:SAM-dependent methyltransferase